MLLRADGEAVPLVYRVAYAFLHREGDREGEARLATDACVNWTNGVFSLGENKTDRPRGWVLDPGVFRMLKAWREMANPEHRPDAPLFPDVKWDKLAPTYRDHCRAAGVDRARLFEKKSNKASPRAHDTRAFFITAARYADRDVLWITDRTGHTSLPMLRTYERDVRRWRELGEAPVPVDEAIPEIAAAIAATNAAAAPRSGGGEGGPNTRKCTGRESNPYASRRRNLNPLRLPVSPPVRDVRIAW